MDKTQYFHRTSIYTKHEEKVMLVDIQNGNAIIPLDPWLATVIALADGQHSINDLVEYLSSHYQGTPPEQLQKTIDSVLERLVDSNAVELSEQPVTLPYYLQLPQNEQDLQTAEKLMAEDNYLAS